MLRGLPTGRLTWRKNGMDELIPVIIAKAFLRIMSV